MKLIENVAIYYILVKNNHNSCYTINITPPLTKVAFDTRRINQETEYNPRRGLQYYHRSEGFIKQDTAAMINTFVKLKSAVDDVKQKYIGSPEWLDSNCRVLSASLDRILRADRQDTEFFEPQLNYLQELVDVRYRLKLSDIEEANVDRLKEVILSKDEPLKHTQLYNITSNTQTPSLNTNGVEQFIKDLLGSVKASSDNKTVERSITFTIKDTIVDDSIKVKG